MEEIHRNQELDIHLGKYDRLPVWQSYDHLAVPQRDELRRIFHGQGRSE